MSARVRILVKLLDSSVRKELPWVSDVIWIATRAVSLAGDVVAQLHYCTKLVRVV